jgi:hypothetical protein
MDIDYFTYKFTFFEPLKGNLINRFTIFALLDHIFPIILKIILKGRLKKNKNIIAIS